MARVFFPTRNDLGVRDVSPRTLGAAPDYSTFRSPAEAAPHPAMNPVTLGVIYARQVMSDGWYPDARPPIMPGPIPQAPITSIPIRAVPPIAAPVSTQNSPTPQVTVPPPSPTPILVTSGGGVVTMNTSTAPASSQLVPASGAAPVIVNTGSAAPAPASSSGVMGDIARWLSGSTALFGYAVPNAVLAGAVALGFAWLSSPSKGRR